MSGKKNEIRITTIIGAGAECNGDFSAEGSVRIDGTVNGSVSASGAVILGATGVVNGDVTAKSAIVGGEVIGNISAPDKVELTATAKVLGDITTNVIIIDEKAVFQGRCDMNQEIPGRKTKPSFKAVRAGKKSAKAALAEALKEVEEANREESASESTTVAEEPAGEQ